MLTATPKQISKRVPKIVKKGDKRGINKITVRQHPTPVQHVHIENRGV